MGKILVIKKFTCVLVSDKVTNAAKEKHANVIFTVDFGQLLDWIVLESFIGIGSKFHF